MSLHAAPSPQTSNTKVEYGIGVEGHFSKIQNSSDIWDLQFFDKSVAIFFNLSFVCYYTNRIVVSVFQLIISSDFHSCVILYCWIKMKQLWTKLQRCLSSLNCIMGIGVVRRVLVGARPPNWSKPKEIRELHHIDKKTLFIFGI